MDLTLIVRRWFLSIARAFGAPKATQRPKLDSHIQEVIEFVSANPNHKHYVVTRLVFTSALLKESLRGKNVVLITTLGMACTGWASHEPNCALSCSQVLKKDGFHHKQLRARLRGPNSKHLIFTKN